MKIDKISFFQVKEEIERILTVSSSLSWHLVPEDIYKLAEQAGKKVSATRIDWWATFENGELEIESELFFNTLFQSIDIKGQQVIIVTDECFEAKEAYSIQSEELFIFADRFYFELHQLPFFQPFDMLFIFPYLKRLVVLHHDGFVMRI